MAPGEFRGQGSGVRGQSGSCGSILRAAHPLVMFSLLLKYVFTLSCVLLTGLSEAFTDPGQPQQVCQSN